MTQNFFPICNFCYSSNRVKERELKAEDYVCRLAIYVCEPCLVRLESRPLLFRVQKSGYDDEQSSSSLIGTR